MGIKENKACHCKAEEQKGDSILSPLKSKMKVLKKIKRRMGLASRSSSNGGGTNNLPPLLFHNIHGENIRISRDGTVAKRVESFCKGIAFSSRPVKVNEKVCIKFLEISNNWSGVIRFGFTYNDPTSLRYGLPKYACPDLTNKPGYWAKALPERFCSQGTILFYYVTSAGDVHFGINGEEKGIFFSSVETRGPLWCLIDVYGNSTAIEFVDIRHQLNNSSRYSGTTNCENVPRDDPVERITYPMQQMAIQTNEEMSLPLLRYQPPQLNYQAMPLHRTRGKNVRFMSNNRSVAFRNDTEFCQGYVFTSRPLQIGERIVVQLLGTEPMFQGCLGLGLTSCDPATLTPADLPDDSNFLLDRPEYWVLSRDFARNLNKGDEISFFISQNGEVKISRNGGAPLVVIHVDQSLRLWAFFDIYGSTQRIRVVSSPSLMSPSRNPERRIITPTTTESMNSINSQSEIRRNSAMQQSNSRLCCVAPADIQVQPSANGGTVLSVILPPTHSNIINTAAPVVQGNLHQHHASQTSVNSHPSQHVSYPGHSNHPSPVTPVAANVMAPVPSSSIPTGTMISTCSSNYVEPISDSSSYSTPLSWAEQNGAILGAGAECTICYEHPIDAVLYMCGHMCMCYECALQQWRGKGGGHCPLCRAVIRDVIRTYKS
ncbi:E3 ubiquitin-protein ligase neur isoform X1 [Leptinotarsa decemlineata]|uniref:E3 ubiquitin-protein ligase neur isoform X1 n=1 Tax=Leptinotarsa decemlineata TaxID=7539 RepID=UPI000C25481C|nr:protein neuralized [Leptinotarsa decemlineata]